MGHGKSRFTMYSMANDALFNGLPWIEPRSAYIHIPFCAHRCGYCDFAIAVGREEEMERYLNALEAEAARVGVPRPVATWYVGGGTPSLLPANLLVRLGAMLKRWFPLVAGGEATLEANPESFDQEKAVLLREAGFNRVSIGVQSFSQVALDALDRPHRAEAAGQAVKVARDHGLNVSVDLIFGAPGQDLSAWNRDIELAAALAPDHVSAYGLTYEKGTPLERRRRAGLVLPVCDDIEHAMFGLVMEKLPALGYQQYEISNYSRPGMESRHNGVYWANEAYWGLGMGAARFVDGERSVNTRDLSEYLRLALSGAPTARPGERLNGLDAARETLYLNLRRARGALPGEFQRRTGRTLQSMLVGLETVMESRLLEQLPDGTVRLTAEGRFLADTVAGEVLVKAGGPA